jgi:polyferredoxin
LFSNIVVFILLISVVLFIISRVNKKALIYSLVLVAADIIAHFYITNHIDSFSTESIVSILNTLYYVSAFSFTLLIILILTYVAKFSTLISGVSGIFVTIFYAFVGIIFFDLLGKNISIFNMVVINKNIFYLILILWFIIDIYVISLGINHNRRLYQLSSALIIDSSLKGFVVASIYQGTTKGFCVPVLNCYACPSAIFSCPLGSIQHFMVIGGVPENIKMFFANLPYYPLGLLGVIAAAVGRMCCGYLCPFGFFQDILFKIKTHKVKIPKFLRHFKYVALVLLVFILPMKLGENWFSKLCPMGTLIGGIPWVSINSDIRGMVRGIFWIKTAILLIYVVFSSISKRPFCQTSCPLGAIYSLFNKVSFFRINWDEKSCTHCNKCEDICPMDIRIYENANPVDCIRCLDCDRCPSVDLTHPFSALEKEEEDILLSYKI